MQKTCCVGMDNKGLLQNAVSKPKQKIDTSKKFWRIAILSNSPELFIIIIISKFYFATGGY